MAIAKPAPDLMAAPAEPYADLKRRAAEAILAARAEILDLSHRIHANPEPAFEERQAATWVAEAVRRHGYAVEHPAGRLETAVRGVLPGGRGGATPRIGILAEYDALPGLGHGCGHNTMAAANPARFPRRSRNSIRPSLPIGSGSFADRDHRPVLAVTSPPPPVRARGRSPHRA
jgi:hypothetical protein